MFILADGASENLNIVKNFAVNFKVNFDLDKLDAACWAYQCARFYRIFISMFNFVATLVIRKQKTPMVLICLAGLSEWF